MTRALSGWSGLFAALLMVATSPAWASDREPGWIPYIDFSIDLHQDALKAEINTAPSPVFQQFEGKENYQNTPLGFIGRLGVLTPAIGIPWKPRFFLGVGVYATPESKEIPLETGNLDLTLDPGGFTDAGLGSRLTRRFQNPAGVVSLGVSLTLPIVDERFRLKPSLEYAVENVEIEGEFRTAAGRPPNRTLFEFEESADEVYHSVGLGLEGEFVMAGGLSLFLNTRLLWVVAGEDLKFTNGPGSVEWVYKRRDSPFFSGAFGVRYSFLGF